MSLPIITKRCPKPYHVAARLCAAHMLYSAFPEYREPMNSKTHVGVAISFVAAFCCIPTASVAQNWEVPQPELFEGASDYCGETSISTSDLGQIHMVWTAYSTESGLEEVVAHYSNQLGESYSIDSSGIYIWRYPFERPRLIIAVSEPGSEDTGIGPCPFPDQAQSIISETRTAHPAADSASDLEREILEVIRMATDGEAENLMNWLRSASLPEPQQWFQRTWGDENGASEFENYQSFAAFLETEDVFEELRSATADRGLTAAEVLYVTPTGDEDHYMNNLVEAMVQRVNLFRVRFVAPGGSAPPTSFFDLGYASWVDGQFRLIGDLHTLR